MPTHLFTIASGTALPSATGLPEGYPFTDTTDDVLYVVRGGAFVKQASLKAGDITYTPTGSIASTDLQGAITETASEAATATGAVSTSLTTHIGLATDAHAASAILFAPVGGLTSINAQAALAELDTKKALVTENVNIVAASGAAQTIPDPSVDRMSKITLTADCTFTFPAAVSGASFRVALVQDATPRAATWPANVKWAGGVAPTLTATAGKIDQFEFRCYGGTNFLGSIIGQNY